MKLKLLMDLKGETMTMSADYPTDKESKELRNEDPLSGEPGAHPVGAGVGTALGGLAAATLAGSIAGPIGTVAGAVIGGIIGGFAGKGISEEIDPTVDSEYWRKEYAARPYYDANLPFEVYEPAYRLGWETFAPNKNWAATEAELRQRWEEENTTTHRQLSWDHARLAAKDAWDKRQANCDTLDCEDKANFDNRR